MNTTQRRLLIISAFLLLVFSGWAVVAWESRTTPQTRETPASLKEGEVVAEIAMREDGYEPSTVNLTSGQAIRFINKASTSRWPASNIHPTHELYAEFDPKKEIKPGESWTFTFRNKGSWRMHDHIYPYMKGLITVN